MNSRNTEQLVGKILGVYGLTYHHIDSVQKGYRNSSFGAILADGSKVNVIIYKNEVGIDRRIRRTNAIGWHLHAKSLPVRYPIVKEILKLRSPAASQYAALYNYLSGETIPWEAYTKNHIKLLGRAMGTIHRELRDFQKELPSVANEYLEITRRMTQYFNDENVIRAMQEKLSVSVDASYFDQASKLLMRCKSLPHQQALHMDFVRGNIVFRFALPEDTLTLEGLAISGILDFEKAAYGSPIFDVARTLSFLLVDCKYKLPEKVTKYFLQSGYNKRGGAALIDPESSLLGQLVILFLVYDFYKFLRHNPYESLTLNEHYRRTKDILLERGVIRYSKRNRRRE